MRLKFFIGAISILGFLILPANAAVKERIKEREAMVSRQIEARGIENPSVLKAMRSVPRHAFVANGFSKSAYADRALPIKHGQTISQPYIVAAMTDALNLQKDDKVLEVGTGSGYQAAVLAEITDRVYSIEIINALAETARDALSRVGYSHPQIRHADGFFGWPEEAPFDAIIVAAAANSIPPPLIDQLRSGGRMVIPVGSAFGAQRLLLVTKDSDGEVHTRTLMPVRFVPFTRETR